MVITNTGVSIQRIIFDEIFWTSMASNLKYFYSTSIVPKHANSWDFSHRHYRDHRHNLNNKSFSHTLGATIRTRAKSVIF